MAKLWHKVCYYFLVQGNLAFTSICTNHPPIAKSALRDWPVGSIFYLQFFRYHFSQPCSVNPLERRSISAFYTQHSLRGVCATSRRPVNSRNSDTPDLIIYYENSSFFLDIIGRSEAFSENRFQVSAQPPAKKSAGLIEKETDLFAV